MHKLPMCRLCLVEDKRMHKVVDKNLHELYEKLTNIPFETQDIRPIHACSFCYAKLKQTCLLKRKYLEVEKLLAQMMEEDYVTNPLRNGGQVELHSGFTKTPIVIININEELSSDKIEPKKEPQTDEPDNLNKINSDVSDIPTYHFETHTKDDIPIKNIKIEIEEQENLDNSYPDVESCYSESDSKVAIPVMYFKTEVEEEQVQINLANSNLDIPPYHYESDSKHDALINIFKTEIREEQEKLDNGQLIVLDIPPYHSKKDSNDGVSTMNSNADVGEDQELSRKIQKIVTRPKREPVAKKQIPDTLTAKQGKSAIQIKQKNSTMEISPNPEESSNAVTVQVDVHHRHCSQLSASVATTNHVCVNETQATSDFSKIHPGYPKTAAERMREYRARKKKETLTVNHQKRKRSAAERAKEYRIRKKMKIHSGGPRTYAEKILKISSDAGIRQRQDDDEGADFSDYGWMSQKGIDEMLKRKKVLNKIRCKRYRDKKKTDANVSSQTKQRTITVEEMEKIKRRREYNREKSKRYRDKKRATKLINLGTDQSSKAVASHVSPYENFHDSEIAGPSTRNVSYVPPIPTADLSLNPNYDNSDSDFDYDDDIHNDSPPQVLSRLETT